MLLRPERGTDSVAEFVVVSDRSTVEVGGLQWSGRDDPLHGIPALPM